MLESNADLPNRPAPALGQHTREILEEMLGYSTADVNALKADGVVETPE
jgi:crotonobetainyl-CoA:carnitine CoA-transferase CaiB-like acyl-CoA transferase